MCCEFLFFFFQAEDGIRDYKVTGVQTCALPISSAWARRSGRVPGLHAAGTGGRGGRGTRRPLRRELLGHGQRGHAGQIGRGAGRGRGEISGGGGSFKKKKKKRRRIYDR